MTIHTDTTIPPPPVLPTCSSSLAFTIISPDCFIFSSSRSYLAIPRTFVFNVITFSSSQNRIPYSSLSIPLYEIDTCMFFLSSPLAVRAYKEKTEFSSIKERTDQNSMPTQCHRFRCRDRMRHANRRERPCGMSMEVTGSVSRLRRTSFVRNEIRGQNSFTIYNSSLD